MGLEVGDVLRMVDLDGKPYGPFWRVVGIDREADGKRFMNYPIRVVSVADHNGLKDEDPFSAQWHSGHYGLVKVTQADIDELKRTTTPIWDDILRKEDA